MRLLSFGQKLAAGFAAAFVILAVGALSSWTARQAMTSSSWVTHTHQVINGLDRVLVDLVDVETGTRGFVITSEPRFLEPYDRGVQDVGAAIAEVRRLTRDNAVQQRALDSLQPRVDAKLAISRRIVEQRTSERAPLDSSKAVMDDVRRRVTAMQAEERRLLVRRDRTLDARERATFVVTLAGSLIAFALVVLMIRVIGQDVALQRRTAAERDRLLVREQAAREQLAAIQRVTDAALAPLALDDLLTELMRRLKEVLAVDTACVLLIMRDGVHLELCKCVGLTEEIEDRVKIPLGEGVEGMIAARGLPATVHDIASEPVVDPVVREHFRSLLGAPLVMREGSTRDRVIGVLHVDSVQQRHFTEAERDLLVLVAERAASAIERARLYEAQRRSEERFRLLVEGVADYAIFLLDAEGLVTSWNAGACRMLGYASAEIAGRSHTVLYDESDRVAGVPELERAEAVACGGALRQGWRVRKDGSRLWAEIAVTTLRDDDEHLLGFAHVTRDLTERREFEQALVAAKDAAEAANSAKSQFLATMSHEIRTPINAIVGYVELLELELDGPLTAEQRTRLARVRGSARHLLNLVTEILDLSKIEAQQLHVDRVRASVREVATSTLPLVFPQASARGQSIVDGCAASDAVFLGDPHRVEQILTNLLSNAVKFTPEGGRITVECGYTEHPDEGGRLVAGQCWCWIRVSDTGVGISRAQRDAIFDPFVQAADGTAVSGVYRRQHGGTGLGLTISRRLALLMGGDITLQSEPGTGSSFTLWLPAPPEVLASDGRGGGCTTEERRRDTRHTRGLAAAGDLLRLNLEPFMRDHTARLRAELGVAGAAGLTDAQLQDHVGTLVADLAWSLVVIEASEGEASPLMRDGSEIQRVIAERHGAQRAGLGWTEQDHRREMEMLQEDMGRLLRHHLASSGHADVDAALDVLRQLVAHAEQAGLRGLRMAIGTTRA